MTFECKTFAFSFDFLQKLSALSASLARVINTAEEEETQLDHFPAEGVKKEFPYDKLLSWTVCAQDYSTIERND